MNRIQPQMGAEAYKTYSIVAPPSTHFRKATCAETDCPDYLNGWRVRVEGLEPEMVHAAKTSGRKYNEVRIAEGETWLYFEAGQPCFRASEHRLRLDRPELYLVRDGDWRGNPRGTKTRMHQRPELWVEDFGEHQQNIADQIERG
ncbi:hypothetical protein [Streptomyces sp. BK340]|uniref:hypothetical protein n=1 Tax=Streptomyces sp. BK340 TaxID=2572903 RepID=UPI0011A70AFE|nr:hypothetical protein [Streptomyces sp. BK340]TVZ96523.1 hypothetical protein FB157_103434 [Streptomyces sp. BK340]